MKEQRYGGTVTYLLFGFQYVTTSLVRIESLGRVLSLLNTPGVVY